jgi:hypothetical protein
VQIVGRALLLALLTLGVCAVIGTAYRPARVVFAPGFFVAWFWTGTEVGGMTAFLGVNLGVAWAGSTAVLLLWRWAANKRSRIAVILAILACVALAWYFVAVLPILMREPVGQPRGALPQAVEGGSEPTSGQFVGHHETSIVERFGPPSWRWEGHYGAPAESYERIYPDAITMTYERKTGTLFLSFCKERGRLVCFRSDWFPVGWVE